MLNKMMLLIILQNKHETLETNRFTIIHHQLLTTANLAGAKRD